MGNGVLPVPEWQKIQRKSATPQTTLPIPWWAKPNPALVQPPTPNKNPNAFDSYATAIKRPGQLAVDPPKVIDNGGGGRPRERGNAYYDTPVQQAPQTDLGFVFGDAAPNLDEIMAASQKSAAASVAGAGYDSQQADLERRKAEALAAIGFGAQDLTNNLKASRGELDARYAQGIQEAAAANNTARDAMVQGMSTTDAASNQAKQNLGIATDNSLAAQDSKFAQSQLAQRAQALDSAMRNNQLSQYTLGTRNADMAQFRGTENQASSRRNFDSTIAQLLDKKAQAIASAQMQAQQNGFDLWSKLNSQWSNNRDFAYKQYQDQQSMAMDQAKQAALNDYRQAMLSKSSGSASQPSAYDQLLSDLSAQGLDGQSQSNLYDLLGKYDSGTPGSFGKVFKGQSPDTQAAFRQYMNKIGIRVQ